MKYSEFEKLIRKAIEKNILVDCLSAPHGHANIHLENTREEEIARIIRDPNIYGTGSFENKQQMEDVLKNLVLYKDNLYRIYNLMNRGQYGDCIVLNYKALEKSTTPMYGIIRENDNKFYEMQTHDARAVIYKFNGGIFGLNLDTFYPLITGCRAERTDADLSKAAENVAYDNDMTFVGQTYMWACGNPEIKGKINYDEDMDIMSIETQDNTTGMLGSFEGTINVKNTLRLDDDRATVVSELNIGGEVKYNLFDQGDLNRFEKKYPNAANTFKTVCGYLEMQRENYLNFSL